MDEWKVHILQCTNRRHKGVFSLNQSSVYKTVVLDYTVRSATKYLYTCDVHYSKMSALSEMPIHIIFIHNLAGES